MRYDDSVKQYSIDRRGPQKNEHLGNVTYTNKFTHSKNRKKKLRRQLALKIGSVAVVSYFVVGGVYMGSKIVDKTKDMIGETQTQIVQMQAENAAVREAEKPVVYTNYTDEEIRNMNFDAKINLYKEYLDYVNAHAEIPYAYQVNGIPDNLNFWRIYSDANYSYSQYQQYAQSVDEQTRKESIQNIFAKYRQAMDIVTQMYNGKYSLNNPDINDKVNLIHNVRSETLGKTL